MTDPVLHTERLILAPPQADDAEVIFRLHSDPRTYAHAPQYVMRDDRQAAARLAEWRADWEGQGLGYFIVRTKAGELVGISGLRVHQWQGRSILNLYYRLLFDAQGHGYAVEAAAAAIAWARTRRPDLPIVAIILPVNTASIRLALKLGLIREPGWDEPTDESLAFVLPESHRT